MGTRADFYVGRGKAARWIGSIAWDGHPQSIMPASEEMEHHPLFGVRHKGAEWPKGKHLFDAKTEADFVERVERFFRFRDDVSLPEDGWPWPWKNSNTTDYSYAFDPTDGKVYGTCFGHGWWLANKGEPEDGTDSVPKIPDSEWPDMSEQMRVRRIGLIVISPP